ncbi:MFS general substrate transporter [Tolypocladium paradoxum]|uniref:MFS general substrate transporter n=1 Tax=Tolypocladium paradoxum TaxID=94208 RepID=A0A2S4KLQ3_9HYPO|nr:MFS general substrate transporter [Tolypocladium paradoxum]
MRRPLSVDLSIRDISCSMGSYDDGSLQWVPTAYAQSFGGFLMAGGCLGHLCMTRLVSSGAFQGFAAACTIPCAQSLVALSFEDPQARGAAGSTGFCIFWLSLLVEGALEIATLALLLTHNLPGLSSWLPSRLLWRNSHGRTRPHSRHLLHSKESTEGQQPTDDASADSPVMSDHDRRSRQSRQRRESEKGPTGYPKAGE